MAFNPPSSPVTNQIYSAASGQNWLWDGTQWQPYNPPLGEAAITAANAINAGSATSLYNGPFVISNVVPNVGMPYRTVGVLKGTNGIVGPATAGTDFVAPNVTTQGSISATGNITSSGAITGNTILANAPLAAGTTGPIGYGAMSYADVNRLATFQTTVNGYSQVEIQNTSSGTSASADMVVANNISTSTTYYGDFGINSSTFSGTGSFGAPNTVYLTATTGDLAIGTTTSNAIHFVIGGSATDAVTINTSGALAVNGSFGTSGQILISSGSSAAPVWGTNISLGLIRALAVNCILP
jgi:hypothetical protein